MTPEMGWASSASFIHPVWLGREKKVQELKVGRPPALLLRVGSAPRDKRMGPRANQLVRIPE